MNTSKISKIEDVINHYKGQTPQLSELLDFFCSVFDLKERWVNRISADLSINRETAVQKIQSGSYLMENLSWSIDRSAFTNIAGDLIELFKKRGEKVNGLEKLFLNIAEPIPTDFSELKGFLMKNEGHVEENTFGYILLQTLSVFYQKKAEAFKNLDYQLYWTKSICPVCGNLPKISRLEKENGKRMFSCFLCWTEWQVTRIGCPYCGNDAQDKLGYFYADGNKTYRVNVCRVCNKYIKTIDERLLGREVIPELEDNITYYLDTLAMKEGYKNPFLEV